LVKIAAANASSSARESERFVARSCGRKTARFDVVTRALSVASFLLVAGGASDSLASSGCPDGMWSSAGSCCELGNEYVASKNQCMPVRPERRCVEGHLGDCVIAGRQLEQRGTIGAGYAAELYKYACEEGHAPACRGLGGLHERGLGVERDEARGRALYEQACGGGDAPACTLLAEKMIAQASGTTKALALFAQACHRGDPYACGEYGEQLARRPEQSKQSALYFERACVGGVGDACRALLDQERGAHAIEPARVQELLERGCRAADAESCVQLGDALRGGTIAPQSSAQAALRYRSACEAGNLSGCVRLAELTALGDGVARDLGRASELYTRACGAGIALACERASTLERTRAHEPPVAAQRAQ
jgi:uncharacterized protein